MHVIANGLQSMLFKNVLLKLTKLYPCEICRKTFDFDTPDWPISRKYSGVIHVEFAHWKKEEIEYLLRHINFLSENIIVVK